MTAADVSVSTETLPGSQVGITIEVPSEQVDRAYDRVLARLAQRVKVEGFRPGKAPRPLIEARVGAAALRDEVADSLLPPIVNQALKDHEIDAIDRPRVEIQELERGRPGRFTARVSIMPGVTLPGLDTVQVDRQNTEVTDAMVAERIDALRDRLAEIEPVEREARLGDIVVADMRVLVDGEEVQNDTATEVELVEGRVIPELLAAVPGKGVGELVRADITIPEDDTREQLRGKPGQVEMTVQGVKEKRVPELTDEVAKELSSGEQETAEALRAAVRDDLTAQARRLDALAFEQAAVKAVIDASQVEIPESLVEHEVEHQLEDMERSLQRRGLRLDRYLGYVGRTLAEQREGMRPEAEDRVRADLVLGELTKRLEVAPSDDDVREYMRAEAERDPQVKAELDSLLANSAAIDYFQHRLTRLRTLEALVVKLGGEPLEGRVEG